MIRPGRGPDTLAYRTSLVCTWRGERTVVHLVLRRRAYRAGRIDSTVPGNAFVARGARTSTHGGSRSCRTCNTALIGGRRPGRVAVIVSVADCRCGRRIHRLAGRLRTRIVVKVRPSRARCARGRTRTCSRVRDRPGSTGHTSGRIIRIRERSRGAIFTGARLGRGARLRRRLLASRTRAPCCAHLC
jgi:hypothetical protein